MGNPHLCADICTSSCVIIVVAAEMDARGGRKLLAVHANKIETYKDK